MIYPIAIVKGVAHVVNELMRGHVVSISPLPTALVQVEVIPAPVEIAAMHPFERSAQVHSPEPEAEPEAETHDIRKLPSPLAVLLGPEPEAEAEAELEIGI
jgi:hypothetical protein